MGNPELAAALRSARTLKNRSLREVAGPADISPTYLQKLERGEVEEPSPRILHRLSTELDLDYAELMRKAGYVIPGRRQGRPVGHALSSEALTPDEERALTSYLRLLREQKDG